MSELLHKLISPTSFQHVRALVVGDVMLDRYWFGDVHRISPEAPVPVLAVHTEEFRAGGAANVAHNITALGAACELLSVIGDDSAGRQIRSIIESNHVRANLFVDTHIKTIVKLRMIAQNQQLLRADFDQAPTDEVLARSLDDYRTSLPNADVVVLSDYGKGGLTHVAAMIKQARAVQVPVIIDPKGDDYTRYAGASLLTPNMKEFEAVVGKVRDEDDFTAKAIKLKQDLQIDSLLVTRSEKGMSLITQNNHKVDSPAIALEVFDVSGAGDTVIALMALAHAIGMSAQASLDLANVVASIVVGKLGTAVASIDEVVARINEKH